MIENITNQMLRINEQPNLIDLLIHKYSYLSNLLETNETLFFNLILNDPAKYLPLVYTPTVGEACEKFGHIARRVRGLFISINQKEHIKDIRRNWLVKIAEEIFRSGLARVKKPKDLRAFIESKMYIPAYK